jgi:hypothetical protein
MRASASFLVFALALTAPIALAQAPSSDEDPLVTARQRYKSGMEAWAAKRYVEAALQFEAATEQKANAAALFMAASSWELANVPDRAADAFSRALSVQGLPQDNAATAKARLAALEAVLGRAEVIAPEGYRVQLDANTEVATPAVLHGSAGVHALAVRAPDKPIERRQVVLQLGQSTKVTITNEPAPQASTAPSAKPPEKPPEPPPSKPVVLQADESFFHRVRRPAGFVSIGIGVAALGAGAIVGLQANDAKDAYNAAPTRASFDHASSLQTWTNLMLIGGGVFTAGGLVLVLWPSPKAEPKAASPTDAAPAKSEEEKESGRLIVVPAPGGFVVRGAF